MLNSEKTISFLDYSIEEIEEELNNVVKEIDCKSKHSYDLRISLENKLEEYLQVENDYNNENTKYFNFYIGPFTVSVYLLPNKKDKIIKIKEVGVWITSFTYLDDGWCYKDDYEFKLKIKNRKEKISKYMNEEFITSCIKDRIIRDGVELCFNNIIKSQESIFEIIKEWRGYIK
jgi:hypothetical protein